MISALFFSALTAAAPAHVTDDGWLAWQGCWRAQGDPTPTLLCVVPASDGARLMTFQGGTLQAESKIIADGLARPVEKEGCRGTEMARWSSDRQRLFLVSKMKCGANVERNLSGIMSMYSANEWLDVQSITTAGKTFARTTHYVSASTPGLPAEVTTALEANKLARETARYAASSLVDLNDVVEATKNVDEQAVAEWLTTFKQQFDLNGKRLLALADAGVSETVIDVLVAVSNPEVFAVRTRMNDDRRDSRGRVLSSSCYDEFYSPWAGPMSYTYGYSRCYDRYYGYDRGYSSWGYSPWQWYAVNTPVVVVRNSANPDARVTRNGYTRDRSGTARDPSPSSAERTRSSTSGSDHRASGNSGASSSSGSTRTAKPRDQ